MIKSDKCCRMSGAIIVCLGLYFVVWGKSKDNYGPEDPNTQEPIEEMDNAKKENFTCCTHGVTTATNLGNGNTTPSEEQVWGKLAIYFLNLRLF